MGMGAMINKVSANTNANADANNLVTTQDLVDFVWRAKKCRPFSVYSTGQTI